jgi:hypothetical protein
MRRLIRSMLDADAVTRSTIPGRVRAEQLKSGSVRPRRSSPRNVNRVTVGASTSSTKWLEGPHQEHAYVQKYCFTDTKPEKGGCSGLAIRKRAQVSDACLTCLRGFTET